LIETNGFEAGREEVDARLQEIADRNEVSVSEVRQRLAREKQLDGVRRDIALEKVFALLEEGSEIR
jgi:FKBP-type peptidyl-prolyl cis-trans isomerase (trigger factor)